MRALFLAILMVIGGAVAQTKGDDPPVKMSKAGICHAMGTRYYAQTKHFIPYRTLAECLKSGGRMPKN